MNGEDIRLADGSLLPIKVNFYTLYLITKSDMQKYQKQIDREEKKKNPDDDKITLLQMEIARIMIYVIMRSNGKKVDEEEAMMLVPIDPEEIEKLFTQFEVKVEEQQKKTTHGMITK